jgi:hypothetical protein
MGPLINPPNYAGESGKHGLPVALVWIIPLLMLAAVLITVGGPLLRFLYYEGGPLLQFFYYESGVEDYLHRTHFVSKDWINNAFDGDPMWPTRLRMVDDLLARRLLDGRSRDEVEALLGPGIRPSDPKWDLTYELGPERSCFRIDSEFLVIRLDSRGRVKEYSLEMH